MIHQFLACLLIPFLFIKDDDDDCVDRKEMREDMTTLREE